jgi:hypothetical protein
MTIIEILKKRWYVLIIVFGIIILLLNSASLFSLLSGESFSTLRLYEKNGSYIPQVTRFTLNDKDFKEFPQLAVVIRDNRQNPIRTFDDGTRFFMIPLTADEMERFNGRYWLNNSGEDRRIFEYNGKYFEYDLPQIH